MPAPSIVRRALLGVLLSGLLLGTAGIASASATLDKTEPAEETSAEDRDSPSWGPIAGACLGVLFGGALAVWQIRGMKNRR